jgi:hypothetical protein
MAIVVVDWVRHPWRAGVVTGIARLLVQPAPYVAPVRVLDLHEDPAAGVLSLAYVVDELGELAGPPLFALAAVGGMGAVGRD